MKAFVRISSERARSCQEMVSGLAAMISLVTAVRGRRSEARWRAGADDLTGLAPRIAKAVRELAGEVVRFAGAKDPGRSAYRELNAPANHHAAFLATVDDHLITRAGSGGIALVQDRELAAGSLRSDEPQRDLRVAQLNQLIPGKERLRRGAQIKGEKLCKRHRHSVKHLLERAHGGTHAVLLDQ